MQITTFISGDGRYIDYQILYYGMELKDPIETKKDCEYLINMLQSNINDLEKLKEVLK
jgi:hypothetical protein